MDCKAVWFILSYDDLLFVAIRVTDNYIAAVEYNGFVYVLDLEGEQKHRLSIREIICGEQAVACHEDTLFVGDNTGVVSLWDLETGTRVANLYYENSPISSLTLLNPNFLATGHRSGLIQVFDIESKQVIRKLVGHQQGYNINQLAYNEQPSRLASASGDSFVKIWHPLSAQCLATFTGHAFCATHITWLDDGNILASSDWKGVIRILHVGKRDIVGIMSDHTSPLTTLTPIGKSSLLSASMNGKLTVWDWRNLTARIRYDVCSWGSLCVSLLKDTTVGNNQLGVITGDMDGNLKHWGPGKSDFKILLNDEWYERGRIDAVASICAMGKLKAVAAAVRIAPQEDAPKEEAPQEVNCVEIQIWTAPKNGTVESNASSQVATSSPRTISSQATLVN